MRSRKLCWETTEAKENVFIINDENKQKYPVHVKKDNKQIFENCTERISGTKRNMHVTLLIQMNFFNKINSS